MLCSQQPVHQPLRRRCRRWRKQSVQMGRGICVCLSRCYQVRSTSSAVGNSSTQTVGAHALVNGCLERSTGCNRVLLETGWSEAEVCVEEVADARNDIPMCEKAIPVPSGSICELANAAQVRQIASQTRCPSAKKLVHGAAEELLLLCLCYYNHVGALFGILFKEWVLRGFYYFYGF